MNRSAKIGGGLVFVFLVLPVLAVLGIAVAIQQTQMPEESLENIVPIVGRALGSFVTCAVTGCEPELLEGMEMHPFGDGLLTGTPVALEIDEWGRVLVAETSRQNVGAEDNRSHSYWLEDDLASRSVEDRRAYYQKWVDAGKFEDRDHFTRETDRVVLLEDRDGDGQAEERRELVAWNDPASGLVAGVEAREGTLFVTSIPSVFRIEDYAATSDGASAEARTEALQTGFGVKTSLIGHDLHGLVWGPDGKLYFSMGDRGYRVVSKEGRLFEPSMGPGRGAVFRMNADGSDLEVFATGVRNPQELAFDDHGNLFTGDNNGDGGDRARVVYLVEGGETGWAMPYQTLVGDYVRGPWVAERLWELQHDTQPAWVLPPVAYLGNGPAGFVHYPGLGLPDRYADAFFLCDYGYTPGRSGIWSFKIEPEGAGMRMVDEHQFAWSVLATDVDFSWDGHLFASVFDQFGGGQSVVRWGHAPSREDPRIDSLAEQAQQPMATRSVEELLALLAFPDQRLRLRAQYALAERGATDGLVALARNEDADEIPRLHAFWALAQIGPNGLAAALPQGLGEAAGWSAEWRGQLAKLAGQADWAEAAPTLRAWLQDEAPRVRFFAAQSLGAIGGEAALVGLFDVIAENADRDVFLRHAAVWAMHRIAERTGDRAAIVARQDDPSRSVRLAVLLALRHAEDPRIAHFLADADPLLRVEAARAIYDLPIDAAMPALAALSARLEPAPADDLQTAQALHRRVLGANVRLRSRAGARALARYAGDETQLESLRRLALDGLGGYSEPAKRDWTMGFYRPLPSADPAILAEVFQAEGRRLVASSVGDRALEIANEIGVLPLEDEELLELATSAARPASERVAALDALSAREAASAQGVLDALIQDPEPEVRSAALRWLRARDPDIGTTRMIEAAGAAATAGERQRAWRSLTDAPDPAAARAIEGGLRAWQNTGNDPATALERLEAARRLGGVPAATADALLAPDLSGDPDALVANRRWALAGGDATRGLAVFQTNGDCQRCHGGGEVGHGGGVGPSLEDVGTRGAEFVLRSMLAPGAEIAAGFGTIAVTRVDGQVVSGLLVTEDEDGITLDLGGATERIPLDEIATRTEPTSGMPPMGLTLAPQDLRDVVAYVLSLSVDEEGNAL